MDKKIIIAGIKRKGDYILRYSGSDTYHRVPAKSLIEAKEKMIKGTTYSLKDVREITTEKLNEYNNQTARIVLTSKEHFNKYSDYITEDNEERLTDLVSCLYSDSSELLGKFLKDCHLNNIDMKNVDNQFYNVQRIIKKSMSLAESCCIIKHVLIYKILMYKPMFEDDMVNYNELRREWLDNPKNYKQDHNVWMIKNSHRWILKNE